jgi:hypothetical protein
MTVLAEDIAWTLTSDGILEHWQAHLDCLRETLVFPCHEHQLPIPDYFGWVLNEYCCDSQLDPWHVEFMFCGFHEELAGTWRKSDATGLNWPESGFCVVARAYSSPAGLRLELEEP